MAQPRIQWLSATRCFSHRPREMRAAFSNSAPVQCKIFSLCKVKLSTLIRAIDNPSKISAADGLLASLDEHEPPRSHRTATTAPLTEAPHSRVREQSHVPTPTSNQRVAAMVSQTLARRARQNQAFLLGRRPGQPSLTTIQELENAKKASDLSKQITRRWRAGDVYAPHDLSATEMDKWRNREGPRFDVFDVLNFKPLENYRVCLPGVHFTMVMRDKQIARLFNNHSFSVRNANV
jgi:small subunit ribosomal protein S18